MDRRRFLALLGSLAAAGTLASCADPISSPSLVSTTAPVTPAPSQGPVGRYEVLRRLQAVIWQSPDHLGTLAATAVASKDPAAIVRFGQEHVAVLPATSSAADPTTEVRWGHRCALLRTARLVSPGLPESVPAVEFQHDGETRWAVALGGEPLLTSKPDGLVWASDAVVPRVSVSVSVAFNPPAGATIDRTVLHEVLRGEWTADQVAGRQLVLGFAGPGSAADAITQDPTASPIRQPILRLIASEPLGDTVAGVSGMHLSTAGGLVESSPDDPTHVIGPLGPLHLPSVTGTGAAVPVIRRTCRHRCPFTRGGRRTGSASDWWSVRAGPSMSGARLAR